MARRGMAGAAWHGTARRGKARQARQGMARLGRARRGGAWLGAARQYFLPTNILDMTIEQWARSVMDAAKMAELGQPDRLELICKMLKEADDAKTALRRAGYGWTGLGLLDTVRQVLDEGE